MDKLAKAKQYLDKRRINRARPGCVHQYTPHDPRLLADYKVRVTVCSKWNSN